MPHMNPLWPTRLRRACEQVGQLREGAARDEARGEVWLILNAVISRFLRGHARTLGRISAQDREDIAAQKSLDLLRRIEQGTWDMEEREPAEIAGFLSQVARYGLLDFLRADRRRKDPPPPREMDSEGMSEWAPPDDPGIPRAPLGTTEPPDLRVERREYVRALRQCVAHLTDRARRIWFFRVLCSMPSKEIASHPDVRLKSGHVDVVLQRARQAMRECMEQQGYEPRDMPPGTFVELWRAYRFGEEA